MSVGAPLWLCFILGRRQMHAIQKLEGLSPRSAEFPEVVEILSQSFFEDPALVWALPDASRRLKPMRWVFKAKMGLSVKTDVVYCDEKFRAVAIWMPPEHTPMMNAWQTLTSGMLWSPLFIGLKPALRAARVFGKLDDFAKKYLHSDYWYLDMLGAKPEFQGQGLGKALVLRGLDECVRGKGVWLATFNPDNLPFYRSFGFKVVDMAEGADHPKIWIMEKNPEG